MFHIFSGGGLFGTYLYRPSFLNGFYCTKYLCESPKVAQSCCRVLLLECAALDESWAEMRARTNTSESRNRTPSFFDKSTGL